MFASLDLFLGLKWGFFSVTHILTLFLGVLLCFLTYWILKRVSGKTQDIILLVLSFFGPIAIIANLVLWGSPLEYLPLHACSINAILGPILVLTRNKTIGNLMILWSAGALLAVVLNNAQADYEVFSVIFAIYFFPHVAEFFLPIVMVKLKKFELHPKYILSTLFITWAIFTVVHFINLGINAYFENKGELLRVNYFYTLGKTGNSLLDFLFGILPYQYWYLLLLLPLIALILGIAYLPVILKMRKTKNAAF